MRTAGAADEWESRGAQPADRHSAYRLLIDPSDSFRDAFTSR